MRLTVRSKRDCAATVEGKAVPTFRDTHSKTWRRYVHATLSRSVLECVQSSAAFCLTCAILSVVLSRAIATDSVAEIRTPPAPAKPRINGPSIFGVRPNHPFLYTIPATGDRPMTFAASRLSSRLHVDATRGQIT